MAKTAAVIYMFIIVMLTSFMILREREQARERALNYLNLLNLLNLVPLIAFLY